MRVTIEHREEATGISGQRRSYYVDCAVVFSEEERAIIKARDLYSHNFSIRASSPLPSQASFVGTGFMRFGGRLLIVGAVVLGIVSGFARMKGEGISVFFLCVGIGLEVYGARRGRRQDMRLEQTNQKITVQQLLADSRFTVHAFDPAHAKVIEDEIRTELVALKGLIKASAELQAKQTFEL